MSNWSNEAGEPYMTAAQLRFEAELDAQYWEEHQQERYEEWYADQPEPEDCPDCDGESVVFNGVCDDCGSDFNDDPYYPNEDAGMEFGLFGGEA